MSKRLKKTAWDHDGDVFFQENAWAYTVFSVYWVNRTLVPAVKDTGRFALFCDNLSAQVSDLSKKSVSDLSGVCWFGVPNATDIWEPVDPSYANLLN